MRCPTLTELPPAPPAKAGWPWTDGTQSSSEVLHGRSWPRISIVTPSLNQGAFVEEAIRSVLLQGYPNLELSVVDGRSTDGSIEAIGKYSAWLARWVCESDAGPANALNKGFRFATGEILGFLNADDFLLQESLANVARAFTMNMRADVISGHGFLKASTNLQITRFSDRWDLRGFAY